MRLETGFKLEETVQQVGEPGEVVEVHDTGETEVTSGLPRMLVIAGVALVGGYALWRWLR